MPSAGHCAVWGCDNDRRYPDKQIILSHVGILIFHYPSNKKDRVAWERLINRAKFKVTSSTRVCSNHFVAGYRCKDCPNSTLYMKGYNVDAETKRKRPSPRKRKDHGQKRKKKQRMSVPELDLDIGHYEKVSDDESAAEVPDPSPCPTPCPSPPPCPPPCPLSNLQQQEECQTPRIWRKVECETPELERRRYFMEQVTSPKTCYRYTGLTRPKLDLVFALINEKSNSLNYWRGSKKTTKSGWSKKKGKERTLTAWEEFVLTLVRTRKGFDVHFLGDTFGITAGQVSCIYNTWIIFLSSELSFLVPWPTQSEIRKCLPKRFKQYQNVRVIIDCLELYLQKPKVLSSQKISWSNYKHWNTAKLLIGITPTGVVSFVPPMWTGSISDKEIVRNSGLLDVLEEGDAVMADKGFLIRDLLTFKKVHLISPAYCRGVRLSARGTTHTRRVASLRSHVERNILKLKQFRILSGVIPLLLKPMLDRIVFVCAALSNLGKRSIK